MGYFGKKKVHGFENYDDKGSDDKFLKNVEKQDTSGFIGESKKSKKSFSSHLSSNVKNVGSGISSAFGSVVKVFNPPKSPEEIIQMKKIQKAQRDAYLKESMRQSGLKGKRLAQKKYGNISNVDNGSVNIVVPKNLTKKNKEKLKRTLREAVKQKQSNVQVQKTIDPLDAIMNVGVSQQYVKKEGVKKKINGESAMDMIMRM